MTRAEQISARFELIQQAIKELHGAPVAFAAASAGWLMVIQYAVRVMLVRFEQHVESRTDIDFGAATKLRLGMEAELESILKGFHAELCDHLGVTPEAAIELARNFKEVVDDICGTRRVT